MTTSNHRLKKAAALGGTALAAAAPLVTSTDAHAGTITVSNTDDSGAGSLRQAIEDANLASGPDTITFDGSVSGTITLTSGDLHIDETLTIVGPGASALTISGNDADCIFYNTGDTTDVTISGLTISDGNCGNAGGAIRHDNAGNLTLDHVVISNNSAPTDDGGAIYFDTFSGALTITDSTISGNTAAGAGGGIYVEDTEDDGSPGVYISDSVITDNTAGERGGGIYLYDPDGSVTVVDTTISDNTAEAGGGVLMVDTDGATSDVLFSRVTVSGNTAEGSGGGMAFYAIDSPLTIENSTISGNTCGGVGGGLAFGFPALPVILAHSTITGNTAGGGGGVYVYAYDFTIDHTIIAGNTGVNAYPDITGTITSTTWSLIGAPDTTTLNADANTILSVDPLLGPLADNGGPTKTHLLLAGSPAYNAGDPAFSAPPSVDQTGGSRVQFGRIDIGAVEIQEPELPEPPIPSTGSSSGAMAAIAAGLLAVGATMRRVARRSSHSA